MIDLGLYDSHLPAYRLASSPLCRCDQSDLASQLGQWLLRNSGPGAAMDRGSGGSCLQPNSMGSGGAAGGSASRPGKHTGRTPASKLGLRYRPGLPGASSVLIESISISKSTGLAIDHSSAARSASRTSNPSNVASLPTPATSSELTGPPPNRERGLASPALPPAITFAAHRVVHAHGLPSPSAQTAATAPYDSARQRPLATAPSTEHVSQLIPLASSSRLPEATPNRRSPQLWTATLPLAGPSTSRGEPSSSKSANTGGPAAEGRLTRDLVTPSDGGSESGNHRTSGQHGNEDSTDHNEAEEILNADEDEDTSEQDIPSRPVSIRRRSNRTVGAIATRGKEINLTPAPVHAQASPAAKRLPRDRPATRRTEPAAEEAADDAAATSTSAPETRASSKRKRTSGPDDHGGTSLRSGARLNNQSQGTADATRCCPRTMIAAGRPDGGCWPGAL